MDKPQYQQALAELSIELAHLQAWIQHNGAKVVVIFEGRDAAGKGGAISAITHKLNPRIVRVAALGKPTEREQQQWYFQRYVAHLPSAGEMVLFDRSWYNRAGVEKVMGFCSDADYQEFLRTCPQFEDMLRGAGIYLLKYWFSVSKQEQRKRFEARLNDPIKRWKFSEMDVYARSRWHAYSDAKDRMLAHTDTANCPWFMVDADDKRAARLNCIRHLLSQIPYQPVPYPDIHLPEIEPAAPQRPSKHEQNWIERHW